MTDHLETTAQSLIQRIAASLSWDNVAITFSGGKDSIVLLDLVHRAFLQSGGSEPKGEKKKKPHVVYFRLAGWNSSDSGVAVDDFVQSVMARSEMQCFHFSIVECTTIQVGLMCFMELHPHVRTFFTGARRSDYTTLAKATSPEIKSSAGWPEQTRILPLLDWSYNAIWDYIDHHGLYYPSLYSQGYTSLGSACQPNPALANDDGTYRHARELKDASSERTGRNSHS